MANIVVCGGSMIGLSAAMMLAGDGHVVTVLETDPTPVPDRPVDGWDWERPGVPQFRQPHNLFPRVRQVLDEALPGMVERLVEDRPVATGVVAVGDAFACTNPSAGRWLSVGLLHAQRLRDAVRDGLDGPAERVSRFDQLTETDVTPFFRNQMAADRQRIVEMDACRDGAEPPAPDPFFAAAAVAMMTDADVVRAFMETVACLALPEEAFARPEIRSKVEACLGQVPEPAPGPDRAELLALLS